MTIREHIETHRAAGYGTETIWKLWNDGKLLTLDEVEEHVKAATKELNKRLEYEKAYAKTLMNNNVSLREGLSELRREKEK